jgi:hypothetical protein
MSRLQVGVETTIKQIREWLPDLTGLLKRINYGSVSAMMGRLKNVDNMTFGNLGRAAGLTEPEISFLAAEINDRLGSEALRPAGPERPRRRAA